MPIHVRSEKVAPIVLLPGDPNRAKWIAEHFFDDAVCTTNYRQMLGYNGSWKGHAVTVQTTGMGGPSATIVCEELKMLGAKVLIRVGTCGAMNNDMEPGDLMLVTAACMTDSTSREIFAAHMSGCDQQLKAGYAATSDFNFLMRAYAIARALNYRVHAGKVASLDRFYGHSDETYKKLAQTGIFAVEMEAASVLTFAATHDMKAACMMTVSDQIYGAKRASEKVIERGVERMVRVALDAVTETF